MGNSGRLDSGFYNENSSSSLKGFRNELFNCWSLDLSIHLGKSTGYGFGGKKDGMENLPVFRGITAAILRVCFFISPRKHLCIYLYSFRVKSFVS